MDSRFTKFDRPKFEDFLKRRFFFAPAFEIYGGTMLFTLICLCLFVDLNKTAKICKIYTMTMLAQLYNINHYDLSLQVLLVYMTMDHQVVQLKQMS